MPTITSDSSIDTLVQHVNQGNGIAVRTGGGINFESGSALQLGGTDMTATLAALANNAARYVVAGPTKTLTSANDKQTIKLGDLAGSTVTLPAATGSGVRFRFLVTVLATSNSHIIKTAPSTDVFIGVIAGARVDSTNVPLAFAAQSTSNTITLNRTTTGSVTLGEYLEIEDVAAATWEASGFLTSTGASFATPFSHV